MALTKCNECGKEVSEKADKCPHCGAPNKSRFGCLSVFLAFLLIGGIGRICSSERSGQRHDSAQQTSQSEKESPHLTQDDVDRLVERWQSQPAPQIEKEPSRSPKETIQNEPFGTVLTQGARRRREYESYIQRELILNGYNVLVSVSGIEANTLEFTCSSFEVNEIAGNSDMLATWMGLGFRQLVLKDYYGNSRTLTLY